jgi:hypothetical protein
VLNDYALISEASDHPGDSAFLSFEPSEAAGLLAALALPDAMKDGP